MTKRETLLYQIAGKLHEAGVPVILKGALITKLILIENGYENFRNTKDIDAHWIGTPVPDMSELVDTVNRALNDSHNDLYVKEERKHTIDGQTAGLVILSRDNEEVYSHLSTFVKPFADKRENNMTWVHKAREWI